ncbi:MAG TPA: ATP-binding protein [Patescibacteria group bacterium]
MHIVRKFFHYLNPMDHLGDKKYSVIFPLFINLLLPILSEIYVYVIAANPMMVGAYIIFLNVFFVIYFSFRDGIQGGIITSVISVIYYFYIIYSRHYSNLQFSSGIVTTIILGFIYLCLALIIGWLKESIDSLIDREANEKIRLQTILQQLPVGVVITDSKGQVTQANGKIEDMLGIKIPLGYTVGVDKSLIPGRQKSRQISSDKSPLFQSLKMRKSVIGKEFGYLRNDGKHLYMQVNSSVILNRNGEVIAAASIISDVTQQKELEKRKDDFVNMASHELKTPITSLKLYIDSVSANIKKYHDSKIDKTLISIKKQTGKLQELVSDLLDVSRLQTGKLSFTKEKFRIDTLVTETIEGIQGGEKKQRIIFENPNPLFVYADRFRIYQVLANLITNAMKYSFEKKEIYLRIKKLEDKIVVGVQDFGIGISVSEQKKVFDRLYQVSGKKEKTFPGLGMGLYISKEIIKKHKGEIWVESTKGKGSTFYFSLPLKGN